MSQGDLVLDMAISWQRLAPDMLMHWNALQPYFEILNLELESEDGERSRRSIPFASDQMFYIYWMGNAVSVYLRECFEIDAPQGLSSIFDNRDSRVVIEDSIETSRLGN